MHPRLSSILFCYFSAITLVAAISINIPGLVHGVSGNRFFNSISHVFNGATAGDCSEHVELISIPKPKDESSLPLGSDTNEASAVAKNQVNNEEGDGNGQSGDTSNTGEIDFASSWSRALSNIMDRTSSKPKVANPDCMDKHPLLTPLQVLLMPSRAHLESHYRAEKQQQNQNAASDDDGIDAAAVIEGSESVAVDALPNADTQNLVYIPRVKRQEDGSSFNSTTTSSIAPTSSLSSSTVTVSSSASGTDSVTSTSESSESVSSSTIPESASSSLDVSTSTPSSAVGSSESSTTAVPTETSASTSVESSAAPSTESQASTSTSQAEGSTTTSTGPESSTGSSTQRETTNASESASQSLTTAESTTTHKDSSSESSESSTPTTSETPEVTSSASTLLSTTTSSGVVHTITQVTFVLITHTPTRSPASSTHSSSAAATSATSATSQPGSLQTKENAGASLINRSVGSSSSNLVMLVSSIATLSLMFVGVGFGSVHLA